MKKKISLIFFFVNKRDARAVVNLVFICIAIRERLWRQPSTWTANTLRRRTATRVTSLGRLYYYYFLSFHVGGGLSPVRINILLLLLIPTLYFYITFCRRIIGNGNYSPKVIIISVSRAPTY